MKTKLTTAGRRRHQQRGWALFVIGLCLVVLGAIVLAHYLIKWANNLMPPTPPVPPPPPEFQPTNSLPTNPPNFVAFYLEIAGGNGDVPFAATVTYGLMPTSNGVSARVVDFTPPGPPPVPPDPTTYSNLVSAWMENWGIDVTGQYLGTPNHATQGYVPISENHDYEWAFLNQGYGTGGILFDASTLTYSLQSITTNNPTTYEANLQRVDLLTGAVVNVSTNPLQAGQFQTAIDWNPPTNAGFYRVQIVPPGGSDAVPAGQRMMTRSLSMQGPVLTPASVRMKNTVAARAQQADAAALQSLTADELPPTNAPAILKR